MAKRGRKRQQPAGREHPPLESALQRARAFLRADQPEEAIELLDPLQPRYPHSVPLLQLLGEAYKSVGDPYQEARCCERALALQPQDLGLLRDLVSLYLALDMPMHALGAARRILAIAPEDGPAGRLHDALTRATHDLAALYGVPDRAAEEAALHMEAGRLALEEGDYQAAMDLSGRASALLPSWPPPRNNLALALSFAGRPEEALAQSRAVLEDNPENPFATANMVRFLVLAGRPEEARPFWERLRRAAGPWEGTDRIKAAEAAAFLEEDEEVYRLLRPALPAGLDSEELAPEDEYVLFLLATAAANLGRPEEAAPWWRRLTSSPTYDEWASTCVEALQAGRPGPGWSPRYPYFTPQRLCPSEAIEAVGPLLQEQKELPAEEFRARAGDLARRHPQLHNVAEFLIWAQALPEAGIPMLRVLGTERAQAALRRFASGQAGPDEARQKALMALAEMGGIGPDEQVRMWLRGEWREVAIQTRRVTTEREWPYAPELYDLMERAIALQRDGRHGQAERLYMQMLQRDPGVKEAYNNLSVIYTEQGEFDRAREMARRALELDPLYLFPRCNLASFALDEGDIEAARELLAPLVDRQEFHPQEMVLYQYLQARILAAEERYEEAGHFLDTALQIDPDYEPARKLKAGLGLLPLGEMVQAMGRLIELQKEGHRRLRRRIRGRITSADPTLEEVLSAYLKESLIGIAACAGPGGNYTALRKGELVAAVRGMLLKRETLARLVKTLRKKDRHALRAVLSGGGVMSGALFGLRYGDDEGESLRWQYGEPESVLGRLRVRGLVAEGEVEGEVWVLVPRELRPLLQEMLGRQVGS